MCSPFVAFLRIFCWSMMLGMYLVFLTSCAKMDEEDWPDNATFGSENQGGDEPIIHLPFSSTRAPLLCVQGAGGLFSHTGKSTKNSLDFDTSNFAKEELFAPISGIVRVHTEDASKNFGNHLNIEVGNGTYVLIAHMSDILVQDGTMVAAGQLIGHEGCTGYCSGDHVHIGLHKGDAKQMAQFGTSIPFRLFAADKTAKASAKAILSSSFICGVVALGDKKNGHSYQSALEIPKGHPNGTLVKTQKSNHVYVIENNAARWIETEDAFLSRGYLFTNVITISMEEFACLKKGGSIDGKGMVDAFFDPSNQLWLVVGSASDVHRYRVRVRNDAWQYVLNSYGLTYTATKLPPYVVLNAILLLNWPAKSGYASFRDGSILREATSSDVYVVSNEIAIPIRSWETFLALGYQSSQIVTLVNGQVSILQKSVGSCSTNVWCLDQASVTTCGSSLDFPLTPNPLPLAPSTPPFRSTPDAGSSSSDAGVTDVTKVTKVVEEEAEEVEENQIAEDETVWMNDMGLDGTQETLMIPSYAWINPDLSEQFAYVYGNGGCFDNVLTKADQVFPEYGYYQVDFSDITFPCVTEITLVSWVNIGTQKPNPGMKNWFWWQNASFCQSGSSLCHLMKNGNSYEEWMIRVSWDPQNGLAPAGNGFTKNSQLK